MATARFPLDEFQMPSLSQCKGPSTHAPSTCYDHKDLNQITVVHGRKRETFEMCLGLLTFHSSFFAARLDESGGFVDSREKTIVLYEDIFVFKCFRCWAYTHRLMDSPPSILDLVSGSKRPTPLFLCKIWVFGEYYGIPGLKNAAIDMLHEQTAVTWVSSSKMIKYVYENTMDGSSLRNFVISLFGETLPSEYFQDQDFRPDFTVDFLCDILPIVAGRNVRMDRMAWAKLDRCNWHDHSGPGGKLRLEGRK